MKRTLFLFWCALLGCFALRPVVVNQAAGAQFLVDDAEKKPKRASKSKLKEELAGAMREALQKSAHVIRVAARLCRAAPGLEQYQQQDTLAVLSDTVDAIASMQLRFIAHLGNIIEQRGSYKKATRTWLEDRRKEVAGLHETVHLLNRELVALEAHVSSSVAAATPAKKQVCWAPARTCLAAASTHRFALSKGLVVAA